MTLAHALGDQAQGPIHRSFTLFVGTRLSKNHAEAAR